MSLECQGIADSAAGFPCAGMVAFHKPESPTGRPSRSFDTLLAMAMTSLLIAVVCMLAMFATGSFIPLLAAAAALLVGWLALVLLSSFKRWPGDP
jgi:CHASE2 domain-containing sensor protein